MQNSFMGVITLYNRILGGMEERWQRTVLQGVAIADRQGEAIRHSGAASSSARRIGPVSVNEMTVLIPKGVQAGYMTPMGWRMAENHMGHWTLQPGDILVPGVCDREVGESIAELMANCDRVAVIGTVADFGSSGALSHWEVTAR